ncbi:mRNA splicing factor [Clavulina sp. PMI_390]|nr:mRNA splicing factor [Clavulina sp. PMI_390]
MSLAANLESRKERLEALRRRKEAGEGDGKPFAFKPRNYDPETRTIKKRALGEAEEDTVENTVEGLAERIVAEDEERRAQDLDLFNIAPKRPNWDLKRDMDKKLNKLERKTQAAIHTLIRQRLAAQRGGSEGESLDLAGTINAKAKADAEDSDDEDDD